MNSVLLPNREEEKFDASKCFVTLEQIENLIAEQKAKLGKLQAKYDATLDEATGDYIYRIEGQIAMLKEVRHMAYVTGGYREA